MSMGNWDEIRTAFHVARRGTVSGAAEALGVHHATVIRHIDALEQRLGTRLFQRHARGYTPTEAGHDLLTVAQTTDEQFSQLAGRIRGRGEEVTGELIVTALASLAPLFLPTITKFQNEHPDLIVRLLTGDRVFRLEYGEAHVAIRAGSPPEEPDNVAQPFCTQEGALYAAQSYIDDYGMPGGEEDLPMHRFVGQDTENPRAPFEIWMRERIPREQFVFRGTDPYVLRQAILQGAGIGYMPLWDAAQHDELVQVMAPREEWTANLWLVTHVDLHRTMKVQSFTRFLKEEIKTGFHV